MLEVMHVGVGGDRRGTGLVEGGGDGRHGRGGYVRNKVENVEEQGWAELVDRWVDGLVGAREEETGGGGGLIGKGGCLKGGWWSASEFSEGKGVGGVGGMSGCPKIE